MPFKSCWEKKNQLNPLAPSILYELITSTYAPKEVISYHIIEGGCANLNIKINLRDEIYPSLLRIYLRDKHSAYREQKIGQLLHQVLPVPKVYSIGSYKSYNFAISEYKIGCTLRDLLLSNQSYDLHDLMYQIGLLLAKLCTLTFPAPGFFDNNLNIIESPNNIDFSKFLNNDVIKSQFDKDDLIQINLYVNRYLALLNINSEKHLVHGDFDPANILVVKSDGKWKVTAILDWEFAFSGSILWDIANMLRYAHRMPHSFQKSFLQGLKEAGIKLPPYWQPLIYVLNIIALLECFMRSDPKKSPMQCADIKILVHYFLKALAVYDSTSLQINLSL